ncbi:hypothetical protein K7432_002643 [Basidiobolus ranarum]
MERKKLVKTTFSRSELEPGVCDCCSKNSWIQFIGKIPLCQECSTTFVASSASLRSERFLTTEVTSTTRRAATSAGAVCYFLESSSDSDTDEQLYDEYFEYSYTKILSDLAEEYLELTERDFEDCLLTCGFLPTTPNDDQVKTEVVDVNLKFEDTLPSDLTVDLKEPILVSEHPKLFEAVPNGVIDSSIRQVATSFSNDNNVKNTLTSENAHDALMEILEDALCDDNGCQQKDLNGIPTDTVKLEETELSLRDQTNDDNLIDKCLLDVMQPSTSSLNSIQSECDYGVTESGKSFLNDGESEAMMNSYGGQKEPTQSVSIKPVDCEPPTTDSMTSHHDPWAICQTENVIVTNDSVPIAVTPIIQVTPRKRGRPRKNPINVQNDLLNVNLPSNPAEPVSNTKELSINDKPTPLLPRKRGRPRKYPIVENPGPKRPRGRPRKYPCGTNLKTPKSQSADDNHPHKTEAPQEIPLLSLDKGFLPTTLGDSTSSAFLTRGITNRISILAENELDVHRFEKNQRVKVLYNDGFWYAGKMVEIYRGKIRIHYDDWEDSFDEWIDSHSKRIYICTDENDEGPIGRRQRRFEIESTVKSEDALTQISLFVKDEAVPFDNFNYEPDSIHEESINYLQERTRERSTISVSASSMDESSEVQSLQFDTESELVGNCDTTNPILLLNDHRSINHDTNQPTLLERWDDSNVNQNDVTKQISSHISNLTRGYNLRSSINTGDEPSTLNLEDSTAKESKKRRTSHNIFKERFKIGSTIEVRDRLKEWCNGSVVAIKGYRILIHYEGWPSTHDEWIEINSKRLKPNTVIEKQQKFEEKELDRLVEEQIADIEKKVVVKRRKPDDKEEPILMAEYFDESNVLEGIESEKWKVYCNQCKVVIKQIRYYCTYCENPSEGYDYESFDLCLWCFSRKFPRKHQHPRSSFAVEYIMEDANIELAPIIGELVTKYEKDLFDESYTEIDGKPYMQAVICEEDRSHISLLKWKKRKICAFCNDEDPNILGGFIGPQPFVYIKVTTEGSKKRKSFWTHDACARYSPEVVQTKEGDWYNVSMALNRGRKMRCAVCKEKGATIGCFEAKCPKSYHILCTKKPMPHFEKGVIFWCPQHESIRSKKEKYNDVFSCDVCNRSFQNDSWYTCVPCSDDYFSSYDLCAECYEQGFPQSHPHLPGDFKKTCLDDILEMQALEDTSKGKNERTIRKKSFAPKHLRRGDKICSYCSSTTSSVWRKGFNGVLMCGDCFQISRVQNSYIKPEAGTISVEEYTSQLCNYEECVDDYTHNPYLTRIACTDTLFDNNIRALYLDSYAPTECHLFSLTIDSTYYDVPGRAPRWATHSGTDYHGTWLPQSVRRALLKYTKPNERILSNFLGRGTDAIECFLLKRKCIGQDINPAAVALSRRNCSFALPPELGITAEHRPTVMQGDSRCLVGPLFEDNSFDHVLSHPPYKDCVAYSTHIEGDLSRFAYSEDFLLEYGKVVDETWRVLKMGRRCTLGIGDNREHCFYIPVGFRMISKYMERGFELEELVVKRQRYCSAFGLGTYLCVQYDFLIFTHEFLVTLRKVDPDKVITHSISDNQSSIHEVKITETTRGIPYCPIARKSVVMGTVWTFKPSSQFSFVSLCTSRMVERFGKDGYNWEEIKIEFAQQKVDLSENHSIETANEKLTELEMAPYERSRLRRIQENNQKLLALGVISDLSEESDDISHCEKLQKLNPHPEPASLLLVVIPHIPNTVILGSQLLEYRAAVLRCAKQAVEKLPPFGDLIVGVQDIRLEQDRLYPMGIHILEDITNNVKEFRLKELIVTVPDGYAKDRRKQCNWEEFEEQKCALDQPVEHVPIVHAYYMVFMKKPKSI